MDHYIAQQRDIRSVGLVVIHGVGETEPGQCVNTLLESLARHVPGYEVDDFSIAWPSSMDANAHRAVQRKATLHGRAVIDAIELHWADLTRLRAGRLNALLGTFRVIFESQHLASAILDRGDGRRSLLQKVLGLLAWMLRGPITGLMIAAASITTVLVFAPSSFRLSEENARLTFLAVQATLFVVALYAFYRVVRGRHFQWVDVVGGVLISTSLLVAFDYAGSLVPFIEQVPPLTSHIDISLNEARDCGGGTNLAGCYTGGVFRIQAWLLRLWGLLMFAFAVFCLLTVAVKSYFPNVQSTRAILTSLSISILQLTLWTTVVVALIYPLMQRVEADHLTQTIAAEAQFAVLRPHLTLDQLQVFQTVRMPIEWIERYKLLCISTALVIFTVLISGCCVAAYRKVGFALSKKNLELTAAKMPSLVSSPMYVGIPIFAFFLYTCFAFWQSGLSHGSIMVHVQNFVLPSVAFLLSTFLSAGATNLIHVVQNVIDHHYDPTVDAALLSKLVKVEDRRPRRAEIHRRLASLLKRHATHGRFDELVFVAHSQGSVVAFDYLLNPGLDFQSIGSATPSMLTLGSPIGSIYQRYFAEYAPEREALKGLPARIRRWVNLYRADDYIGGPVRDIAGLSVENRVMPVGGHMNYWSDEATARTLDELIRGSTAPVRIEAVA